ncbi:MAG: phage tail tape measure protein, partial [Propionibacteriaceae bacterium]|nr:phage tail tape measure protein [Propionibacteriaceae bacterium]
MSRTVEVRLRANISEFNAGMAGARRVAGQTAASIKAGWIETAGAIRKHNAELDRVGTGMLKAGALVAAGIGLSVKAAMSWESAFAGVRKTVDDLDPAFASLEGQLRGLARTMATSHEDIAAVAENAGALGVATKDISRFTRQMIILGETTNVTADEASTYMAQLMTIMGTAPEKVGNLAAALVDLGNNGASTEAQILEMSQRIAGAGRAVGLTEAQVMGFASAIASTGINVEAGGSAISRVFTNLDRIITQGGHKLQTLNELVGGDFATAFRQDASSAVITFIEALGRLQDQGGSITSVLDDIGIKQIYQTDVIRRLAGAHDLLAYQVGISEKAMQDGTAALVEYQKRMETADSRAAVAWNNIKDAGIEFGNEMLPVIANAADGLSELMQTFQGLPGPVKSASVQIAGVTAAALLLGGGTLKAVVAGVKLVDTFNGFAKSSPKAAAGMRKAAAAAAILAVATVALRAYGRALDDAAEAHRTKWADISTGLLGAFNSGKPLDLDTMLRFEEGMLSKKVTWGLSNSLKRAFNSSWSESFGDSINSMIFGTSTADQIKGQVAEIDKALAALASSGNGEAAADGFRQIADAAKEVGVPIEQVLPALRQYRSELEMLAEGLGLQGQITEGEFVDWMGGKVPAAVRAAIEASNGATDALTDQQKALLGISDAAKDAVKSMREYANLALALSGSALGVQQAFDAGSTPGTWDTDSKGKPTGGISGGILKGGGFSLKTKAGQHNVEQINTMAAAANAYIEALQEAGADTPKLTAETEKWQKALAKAYVEGGKNAEVAAALAATYIAMPEEIAPTFSAPGAVVTKKQADDLDEVLRQFPSEAETEILAPGARPSKKEVAEFVDQVHDVPDETLARIKTIAELAGVDAAQAALDRLRDKTVTVRFNQVGSPNYVADGGMFTRRSGGRMMRA